MALTAKNKLFVEEYVANHYNATQAYMTIYNCDYNTANSKACNVLKKPEVKEYMKEVQRERTERLNITADRVLEELASIAFAEKGDADIPAAAKNKALELIQKQIGAQAPTRVEADVNNQVVFIDDTNTIE
jgi:phage terminase small subunit